MHQSRTCQHFVKSSFFFARQHEQQTAELEAKIARAKKLHKEEEARADDLEIRYGPELSVGPIVT